MEPRIIIFPVCAPTASQKKRAAAVPIANASLPIRSAMAHASPNTLINRKMKR